MNRYNQAHKFANTGDVSNAGFWAIAATMIFGALTVGGFLGSVYFGLFPHML